MKIETKRSDKDRRLAELAQEFRAGRLVLADYLEQAHRTIVDARKGGVAVLEAAIQARLLSKTALRDSYDMKIEWIPDYLHREIAALEQALELYGLGQEREARALLREVT